MKYSSNSLDILNYVFHFSFIFNSCLYSAMTFFIVSYGKTIFEPLYNPSLTRLTDMYQLGDYFFICHLAAQWPTLGHYHGNSLLHPMLITEFFQFLTQMSTFSYRFYSFTLCLSTCQKLLKMVQDKVSLTL